MGSLIEMKASLGNSLIKKLFPLMLSLLLCCETKKEQSSDQLFEQKLDSLFSTVSDFSGVVLVADHGKPVYHKAFGYRNFDTKEPMEVNSIFELASVSKQFTAMTIMILREDGKLDYDDPIEKYIPRLPYPGITIRNLLNHTSGLPDYQSVMDEHWDKTKVAGNEDNIAYLIKYKPAKNFEPGEKYEYSNTGYMLLASIAEKASDKDFIQFCHDRIFDPLQMRDTDIRSKEQKLKLGNMAWGYQYVEEKQRFVSADSFPSSNYTVWLGDRKGPGRISSTASDLLKWDQALYGEKVVKKETLEEAFAPAKLNNDSISNYGFGWSIINDTPMGKIVWHNGDNPGYKTHIFRYIDADKTWIVLCNNAHAKYRELVVGVGGMVEGL